MYDTHHDLLHAGDIHHYALTEFEKPENARWLALLIDTEGSLGWTRTTWRGNRVNHEWRYVYHYAEPYISIGMSERESKETVDEAGRLMRTKAYTIRRRVDTDIRLERVVRVDGTRALKVMQSCSPYFVKQKRMAELCLTLFKYHPYSRRTKFERVITELVGEYLMAVEVNATLFEMTDEEFKRLLEKAEELTERHLK